MLRRSLFRSTSAVAAALVLAGCSASSANVVTVTLAVVQAEGPAIYSAFEQLFPSVLPKLPAAEQATAATLLSTLEADVAAFGKIPAGGSFASEAQAVIADASSILGLVGPLLPAPTVLAINAGLGLFSALLAGAATVTVPAAFAAPGGAVGAAAVVPGPVPIPLS